MKLFLPSAIAAGVCSLVAPVMAGRDTFVAGHCLECHDNDVQKGGLNFESLLDKGKEGEVDTWERILRQIDARQMPPLGKDRPGEEEYSNAAASLTGELDAIVQESPNPGRTDSLRRLTRTEYGNAIRDLLGLDVDVKELLPADEASDGFDNVTVGELSPSLLDRYLSAAQKISRLAVGIPLSQPDSRTIRIRPDITQEHHIEGLPLGTRGGTLVSHTFPRDGDYEVRIFLTRDRNELIEGLTRPHQMEILLGGVPVAELDVKPPRNRKDHTRADANLKARIRATAGPVELGVTFREDHNSLAETLRQPYESQFNFHRHPRVSPAIYQITITGPFDDQGPGDTPSRRRVLAFSPGETRSPVEAARQNVKALLRLAWRRPVTGEDVERILPFFETAFESDGDFEAGMESALSAILVSREFLFRTESDPDDVAPQTPYALGAEDLASRLSFFLWSSLPDETLISAVEQDVLTDPKQLVSQARRMLQDSRAGALVQNFVDQWLYLRNLDSITPDGRLYPDFDHNLREAMRKETELLISDVIREDRSVLDLLKSDRTWLNERLAKHYGIPHVYGSRFRGVRVAPESNRGGLLRHASILTVTSYATRTSPVIRGNWILENLLGTPPPPPPPDIPALEDVAVSADLPIRERLAAHREKAACASCHNLMDPIGFALENYDAIGRWREFENGTPVDATGALPGSVSFTGVAGLEKGMVERPERFVRTLTEKLLIYALGRGLEPTDAAAVRKIVRDASETGCRFSDLVSGIVTSEPFRMRMSAGGEVDEHGRDEL
ncbi:MAG: DUF1592 domain-containing protein [Verrucomicrobiales bacterium]|nr:DUF1592 domain-containing protein [Verrucomicrobiales bacterium]